MPITSVFGGPGAKLKDLQMKLRRVHPSPLANLINVSQKPDMTPRPDNRRRAENENIDPMVGAFNPLGDFRDPVRAPAASAIHHINAGPINLIDATSFRLAQRIDLGDFVKGTLAITGTVTNIAGYARDRSLHMECRVYAILAGSRIIVSEMSVGARGDLVSPGPILLRFVEETMPDAVEIHGRGRRGGTATTGALATYETCVMNISGRFLRKGAV